MRRTSSGAYVAAALLAAATACSSAPPSGPTAAGSATVRVAGGVRHGVAWGLWAFEQDQDGRRVLCLAMSGARSHSATGAPGVPPTGGCGFNADHPGGGYAVGGPGPGASMVAFGPLPVRAVAVRVAGGRLRTRPLPRLPGLRAGRFWIRFTARGASRTGRPATAPVPLDAHGHRVPFQAF